MKGSILEGTRQGQKGGHRRCRRHSEDLGAEDGVEDVEMLDLQELVKSWRWERLENWGWKGGECWWHGHCDTSMTGKNERKSMFCLGSVWTWVSLDSD